MKSLLLPMLVLTAALSFMANCLSSSSAVVTAPTTQAPASRPLPLLATWGQRTVPVSAQLDPNYYGDWIVASVRVDGYHPASPSIAQDVALVAAKGAKLALVDGNWPADSATADQMTVAFFSQQGKALAARLAPLKVLYPNPPGPVYLITNNECQFQFPSAAYDWPTLWTAFLAPIRQATNPWTLKVIAYEHAERSSVSPGVLFDGVSTGAYDHRDTYSPFNTMNSAHWRLGVDASRTISISQGCAAWYDDSAQWRYRFGMLTTWAAWGLQACPGDCAPLLIHYSDQADPNALPYWQVAAMSVKTIWTYPGLRPLWQGN